MDFLHIFFQIRDKHNKALAFIARELALLKASMLKEQRRLEVLIDEKTRAANALSLENERLKKQNKKLQSNVKMLNPDNDMDMSIPLPVFQGSRIFRRSSQPYKINRLSTHNLLTVFLKNIIN